MDIKDRTAEFQQSVLSYKKRNRSAATDISKTNAAVSPKRGASEFQKKASNIAHEISNTAQLLSKLALLAQRKPMFNDNPVEIAELSFLIKRKIYAVEQSLVDLSQYQRKVSSDSNSAGSRTGKDAQHSKNVMNLLNTKMKNISGNFKTVLEERQKMELANKDRWNRITTSEETAVQSAVQGGQVSGNQQDMVVYNNSNPFLSSLVNESDDKNSENSNLMTLPQSSQSLLLQMEEGNLNTNVYLEERDRAMRTIESTIQEVGGLFQQLASMVREQGEVIQRIDANVDDIDMNVTGAQRELLKYFDRIRSNRWLVVKIFFIIFVFFLIWVLVN